MTRSTRHLILLPAILVLGLSACTTTPQWSDKGGNKQDGLVRLSYQYPEFHQPNVSDAQAEKLAENRCAAWGYRHAEPVAGVVRACSNSEGGNCTQWTVTREFQCRSGDASLSARLSR